MRRLAAQSAVNGTGRVHAEAGRRAQKHERLTEDGEYMSALSKTTFLGTHATNEEIMIDVVCKNNPVGLWDKRIVPT